MTFVRAKVTDLWAQPCGAARDAVATFLPVIRWQTNLVKLTQAAADSANNAPFVEAKEDF